MVALASIQKKTAGRTFVAVVSVLALVALIQFGAIAWLLARHSPPPVEATTTAPSATMEKPETRQLTVNDSFAAEPAPTPVPPVAPVASPTPVAAAQATPQAAATPFQMPRPTPVPAEEREVGVRAMLAELVDQARALRSRGDTVNAITRLREADRMNPGNAETISELAYTYEKMALNEKALQEWRRILEMGEEAGPLYSAAQAKLSNVTAGTSAAASGNSPASSATPAESLPGIDEGKQLGILDVTATDKTDGSSEKRMVLKIPVKKRPGLEVDVRDVAVFVLFYDMLEDATVVQTNANITYRWTTVPADWSDDDIEILEAEYNQPRRVGEKRTYFGYIVRVYFKKQLQAWRAEPAKLRTQYPAPPTLQPEDLK